jgi:hypothetical protein
VLVLVDVLVEVEVELELDVVLPVALVEPGGVTSLVEVQPTTKSDASKAVLRINTPYSATRLGATGCFLDSCALTVAACSDWRAAQPDSRLYAR